MMISRMFNNLLKSYCSGKPKNNLISNFLGNWPKRFCPNFNNYVYSL